MFIVKLIVQSLSVNPQETHKYNILYEALMKNNTNYKPFFPVINFEGNSCVLWIFNKGAYLS